MLFVITWYQYNSIQSPIFLGGGNPAEVGEEMIAVMEMVVVQASMVKSQTPALVAAILYLVQCFSKLQNKAGLGQIRE